MADGIRTMPTGDPDITIGWGVVRHAIQWLIQPDGPDAGKPWNPTPGQLHWLLWWYAIDDEGRWLFHHGIRRLAKGSGKSPFAAVMAIEELLGPVHFDHFDPEAPGGAVGKPASMPLVQIAATAESQTANTMRMVRAMLAKDSKVAVHYGVDVGKTIMYVPATNGELKVITSSSSSAEGGQPTFVVMDETEHWTPASGGQELASTLKRNASKRGRSIETANAWEPGSGSVAEASFAAWEAQNEGRTRPREQAGSKFLYDAVIAAPDTDLKDEKSMTAALDFVYDDCWWTDRRTILSHAWDGQTTADVVRRFFLNQPTASEDAWTTPMEWASLTAELAEGIEGPVRRIQDGEDVVLFFDGSKSRDATGLVGCAMSDGHVFTVGGWEPDGENDVPVIEVDACVARAFDRWSVVAFFADVREWESFAKVSWPEQYGERLLIQAKASADLAIAWDMRTKTFDFTAAAELALTEIVEKTFTHDGDPMLGRHVTNARRRPNKWGVSVGKESKDSSKKIDLAVCMIGARMVRRLVLASDAWKKRKGPSGPNTIILL